MACAPQPACRAFRNLAGLQDDARGLVLSGRLRFGDIVDDMASRSGLELVIDLDVFAVEPC